MGAFVTPLRYPGGKRKLSPFFKTLITANGLIGCSYAEPYAGGAGLALKLLFQGLVSHVYLNDNDPSVFAFWSSVLNEPTELCRMISSTRVNMKNWSLQREVQQNREKATTLELGFSTFFLNRTNRSGILRGGVIGGKEQVGKYKLNVRYNKKDLIKRIQSIAKKRAHITVSNSDGRNFVSSITNQIPNGLLLYLDPPYFMKGKALYENHFQQKDHKDLVELVKQIQGNWVVSYDNVAEIKTLYDWCKSFEYAINYTAQTKSAGSEIMFFSPNLVVPSNSSSAIKIDPSSAESGSVCRAGLAPHAHQPDRRRR